jgi:hypothetical protein
MVRIKEIPHPDHPGHLVIFFDWGGKVQFLNQNTPGKRLSLGRVVN